MAKSSSSKTNDAPTSSTATADPPAAGKSAEPAAATSRNDPTPAATQQPKTPAVYGAIHRVLAALSRDGIGKTRDNKAQGFKFRGVDDAMNALSPLLAEYGLLILPRSICSERTEKPTQKGGVLTQVVSHVEYDFVAVADGSRHPVAMDGEAMDSGDKATGKSLSMAYKTLCFQAFCIPTEGTPDADAETHEPAPRERALATTEAARQERYGQGTPAQRQAAAAQTASPTAKGTTPEGTAFHADLVSWDAQFVGDKLPCEGGDLISYVVGQGKQCQFPADVPCWSESQVKTAKGWVAKFEKEMRRIRVPALFLQVGWSMDDLRTEMELPDGASPETMSLGQLREACGLIEGALVEVA